MGCEKWKSVGNNPTKQKMFASHKDPLLDREFISGAVMDDIFLPSEK